MRVREVLRNKPEHLVAIDPDRTVHEAVCQLNAHRIGALVVVKDGKVAGILTERDILVECGERCARLFGPGPDPGPAGCDLLVRDIMTSNPVVALPDDGLNYVIGVMARNSIRHLPVVEQGALVGIISQDDVIRAHAEEADVESRMMRDYIQA